MRTWTVLIYRQTRQPVRYSVQAHDRAHAAFKAWRAGGRSQFPRVNRVAGRFTFDRQMVDVWEAA